MPATRAPLVIVCDDLADAPAPLGFASLESRLHRALPGTAVLEVPGLCRTPVALGEAIAAFDSPRVVIGCRAATAQRREIAASLRRAGLSSVGAELVDLRPADSASGDVVFEQSVAVLRAAVARVLQADLTAPIQETTSLSAGGLSRRSLLRGASLSRRPVALWRPGHCGAGGACAGCVLSCPHGALRREAGRVVVDRACCTGCGACVAACRNGAFALPGAALAAISDAAAVLADFIRGSGCGSGVAIACQNTLRAPLVGERYLTLRVPSLEMVTAGWLLQLIAADLRVLVVACQDDDCEQRAGVLGAFVQELTASLGSGPDRSRPTTSDTGRNGPADRSLELREPEATTLALAALGAIGPDQPAWRVEGAGCPLGLVEIDSAACTGCGACELACATRAIGAKRGEDGSLRLHFDPNLCTACGACVTICPERAVKVDRVLDSREIRAGGRVLVTRRAVVCESCGRSLVTALGPGAAESLGASYPFLGPATAKLCADCRLGGRSVTGGTR